MTVTVALAVAISLAWLLPKKESVPVIIGLPYFLITSRPLNDVIISSFMHPKRGHHLPRYIL